MQILVTKQPVVYLRFRFVKEDTTMKNEVMIHEYKIM